MESQSDSSQKQPVRKENSIIVVLSFLGKTYKKRLFIEKCLAYLDLLSSNQIITLKKKLEKKEKIKVLV